MTKKALLLLSLLLCGCATPAVVFVSGNYNPSAVKRVALASFSDYPNQQGSGEVAAATFEKYIVGSSYSLVERRQVSQIIKDHALNVSGAVDQSTIRNMGQLLGVDALIFGAITTYADVRQQTVMTQVLQVQNEPVFMQGGGPGGHGGIRNSQRLVTNYVPETQTLPAKLGLSVRLVDVQTGEVLWSASASGTGESLSLAAEDASSAIMKEINARLTKIAKAK